MGNGGDDMLFDASVPAGTRQCFDENRDSPNAPLDPSRSHQGFARRCAGRTAVGTLAPAMTVKHSRQLGLWAGMSRLNESQFNAGPKEDVN